MEQDIVRANNRSRLKRRIILVFIGVCLLLVLVYAAVSIAENLLYHQKKSEYSSQFIFHPADYELNIFDDAEYMDYNRDVTFVDGPVSRLLVDEDDYLAYGDDVAFMVGYIQSIINGDAETYNACFSEKYYTQNEPIERFTMQKLYNITLTRADTQIEGDGADTYTMYGYVVEYMIRHNNGTFRNDLGSDSIRAQYMVISDREGEWKIDQVITYSYS